jgi:hypothetical protein
MPIPVELKQKREAEHRINFMSRLSVLAADEVLSIAQEVMGYSAMSSINRIGDTDPRAKIIPVAFHTYCNHLLNERIPIKDGAYEPHPMYMRAFMLDLLKTVKGFIQTIPRPYQMVEVPSHE